LSQLQIILGRIQKYLGALSASQKLLIGCLGVILVMTLFLVSQYAGRPAMVELVPGAPAEEQQRAAVFLQTNHFKYEDRGGRPFVPTSTRDVAYAALVEAGQQPANSALVFENILKTQNWLNTKEQNRQIYKVMLDNWLSGVITNFSGVKLARVFVDNPEPSGLGTSVRTPKASITIFMESGKTLSQETVDAAATLVSGSVAGLELSRVSVTDGVTNRPRKPSEEGSLTTSTYREYATAVEKQFREKLWNMVSYIDGVVVEVTAAVDVSRVRAQVSKNLPLDEGSISVPKKETSSSTTETQAARGAEPGLRSNATANVNEGGSTPGIKSEQKQDDTEYDNHVGTRVEQIDDPRGMPTRLVATVAVPRSYIVSLLKASREETAPPPTDDEVQKRFTFEETQITKMLTGHLKTLSPEGGSTDGEVVVTLISGDALAGIPGGRSPMNEAESVPGLGALGTLMAMGGGMNGMLDKVVLGVLAFVALGMMVLMVRKAGRHVAPPTTEQLAGAPPTLQTTDDLVGEADESDTAMAGIIVGEDDLKATKLREQVSDLIKKSPDTAVKVLNRWVSVEE
jgi:flagellar biosynthesis/type III secretory pathway M-ring protein FliF/YscJ